MQVEFLSKFSKDLDLISLKSVKTNLAKLIRKIETEESLASIPNLKKLTGHRSAYRVRLGNYRVGFFTRTTRSFSLESFTGKIFTKCFHRLHIQLHSLPANRPLRCEKREARLPDLTLPLSLSFSLCNWPLISRYASHSI
jgi:mRNA interferase RelE/StbE